MHSERCTVLAHRNGSFPADQPLTLGQELVERLSAEHVEVIKEGAQAAGAKGDNVKDVGQVYGSITGLINRLQTMRCRAPS